MHLLDHITVNDFIIASMLADNSKEAQKKLASRLNNIFGDDVAEGFFEGEEFNELVQQTISLIPVWLENGSVQKQTWSMQGVYFEPEQSFDTGAVEVYQLTQQTSDSEKNKAFRFSAYLNGLFEGNRLLKNLRSNLIMVFFGEIYALRLWFGGDWSGGSTLRRERSNHASMGT